MNSVYSSGTPAFYPFVITAAALLAIIFFICGLIWLPRPKSYQVLKWIMYGAWVIGPPIWFCWEFFYFRTHGRPECFEAFKYGQDLASKVWLAVAAILGALFFGKALLKG
jgi:hypothetical protein